MIQMMNSIEVKRPVSAVFNFVADYRNNPKWQPVVKVEPLSNGPIGKGSRFRQRFEVMGSEYELTGEITGFEPDRWIAFAYTSPVFVWQGDYRFESLSAGTRLSVTGNVSLIGPFLLFEALAEAQIRQLVSSYGPNLKQVLELE